MDANLTAKNDQLLAKIRAEVLADNSKVENVNLCKALMYCMLSQWINEMEED